MLLDLSLGNDLTFSMDSGKKGESQFDKICKVSFSIE
jgi:hypothetical protein